MLGAFEFGNTRFEFFYLGKRLLPLLVVVSISCMMATIATDEQLQILNTVVCLVSVFVMDYFFRSEYAVKMLRHYQAMFQYIIRGICHLDKVWRANDQDVTFAIVDSTSVFDCFSGAWVSMRLNPSIVHNAHCARRITLRNFVASIDRTLLQVTSRLVVMRAQSIAGTTVAAEHGSTSWISAYFRLFSISQSSSVIRFSAFSVLCIVFTGALAAPCAEYILDFRSEKKSAGRQFHATFATRFVIHALPSLDSKSNYTSFATGGQLTC